MQTQIEQTRDGLAAIGLEVEWLRWWDDSQRGDLIHYFGAAPFEQLQLARNKSVPIVMTYLFTATCNRSDLELRIQGGIVKTVLGLPFGEGVKQQLNWRSFSQCSHNIVGLEAERRVLELVYGIPPARTSVVQLGLPDVFIDAKPGDRASECLVCVGTITERKNCVPLAKLARRAQVPVLFVGKPYTANDPYWLEFRAQIDEKWVRYQPHVENVAAMIALLQQARGAVIMSEYENWCLAAHEAAACGLPVLLPAKKWSIERFGSQAHYFSGEVNRDVAILRDFYERCPRLPAAKIQLCRWTEVAEKLRALYLKVLKTSR